MHYHIPPTHHTHTYIPNHFNSSPHLQANPCKRSINQELQQEDQDPIVSMDSQKNPNLETTQNHHVLPSPSSSSHDFKKLAHQHEKNVTVSNKTIENEGCINKNPNNYDQVIKKPNIVSCLSPAVGKEDMTTPPVVVVEESGRERLKRHRVEMAGRVWIPDTWGHEDLLKDWIDCTVFDSSLGNKTIMSARAAMIQEGRSTIRIENKC